MAAPHPQTRQETDSMGAIAVPCDRYWGAQTQRSIRYFSIGQDKMPLEVVRAIAVAKKASALANAALGKLPQAKADLIVRAADEIIAGHLDDHFPLHVWMTGSGTQCNMNVNEVIANRAIEMAGGEIGSKTPIHPNDHVNMSQSSNDVFPTAMHIAAAQALTHTLRPAITGLRDALDQKAQAWADIVKIGRTHMQDAVPLTLGQEFSGYVGMLDDNLRRIEGALPGLYQLALGGTALGTGLNAGAGFAEAAAEHIATITGLPFVTAPNKFTVMGAHDAMVMASGVLKTLAVSLYKIANDIRLLSCGPRAGFAELHLPENEPGSSIMPGKVNPTQCEALAMVAVQVMGYDAAVAFAGASGYLEMNVYKPMMIFNLLQSARLMADSCQNFTEFLVAGMTPNRKQIDQYVEQSLMLVTALSPAIGYDKASQIAHHAFEHDLTLRAAALALGHVSEAEFDRLINPHAMTHP
ncbi:MAG: class II fumarate hydratase [Leptolyngbya sp. DLM2.Bin27]|nr:MAG: class II fumarate hydratase [Leptolyngbya sp. DLM2.Bin27]